MWSGDPKEASPDTHVSFRSQFRVTEKQAVEISMFSTVPAILELDGDPVLDGPIRFVANHPEYLARTVTLEAGQHDLLLRCHTKEWSLA